MIFGVMFSSGLFMGNTGAIAASAPQSIFTSLKSTNSLKKLDATLPNETIMGEENSNSSNLLNSKNNDLLFSYGVDTKNVKTVKTVKDNRNARTISKVEFDNNRTVAFDSDNKIISIYNFKNNDEKKLQSALANKVNSNADLSDLIKNIEQNNNLKDGYVLLKSEIFDEDYWELGWEQKLDNGVLNQFTSIKVFVDRKDKSIVAYNKFSMAPNTTKPVINENDAMASAQSVLSKISNIKNKTISLATTRPNFYWNDTVGYDQADFVRLAYEISINDGSYLIYIDAVTGENLGGATSRSENGKAFADLNENWAALKASTVSAGMQTLGYASSSWVGTGPLMKTSILNYISLSTAYALYTYSHAGPTVLTDNNTWWLYTSEVSGNWHFVFLDGCSTAADAGWANAFHINGYSNRAFLGWTTTVYDNYMFIYASYFWPNVGTGSIRDIAVWAADQVPGTGTTPIRFYGDSSYNGRAWS